MCRNCKECLITRKSEFKNIEEIVDNIREGTELEIKALGETHKVKVRFNDYQEITITDGDNEDFLCNLLDFAYEIKKLN